MKRLFPRSGRSCTFWFRLLVFAFTILHSSFSIASGASAPPIATGQTLCYDAAGAVIDCAGTGQDGEKRPGDAWPAPRFTDNANGTVTDNLTGLIWLKNANCTDTAGGVAKSGGSLTWANALAWSSAMASGTCGLTDGSTAGQWRLPSFQELKTLLNLSQATPATWLNTQGFSNVQAGGYWSSTTGAGNTSVAWVVNVSVGDASFNYKAYNYFVWPVRGGQ